MKRIIAGVVGVVMMLGAAPTVATATDVDVLEAKVLELQYKVAWYENKMMKMSQAVEFVNNYSDDINRCDINSDGLIDAVDASVVLQVYALLSTGTDVKHISEVLN